MKGKFGPRVGRDDMSSIVLCEPWDPWSLSFFLTWNIYDFLNWLETRRRVPERYKVRLVNLNRNAQKENNGSVRVTDSPADWESASSIHWVHPKGNQPWLFIGRTDAKAEVPILWPLDAKIQLVGIEGKRRRQQRMRWLDSITNSMEMNLSKLQEIVKNREAWSASVHGAAKSWTRLSDWTTTMYIEQLNLLLSHWINNILRLRSRGTGYLGCVFSFFFFFICSEFCVFNE